MKDLERILVPIDFGPGSRELISYGFRLAERLGAQFESVDVLQDQGIRQGIKAYSDWPTIPQLYVDGQFVGGCDIVTEMAQSGELAKLLAR